MDSNRPVKFNVKDREQNKIIASYTGFVQADTHCVNLEPWPSMADHTYRYVVEPVRACNA